MQSDEELMRAARVRAEEKVGFYSHFSAYIIVNALLVLVWWFGGDGYPCLSSRWASGGFLSSFTPCASSWEERARPTGWRSESTSD
ncbi:MAG: 2TM domain-containing protein [Halobacteriota archaeon]